MNKFTVPYFQTPNDIFKLDLKVNEKLVYIYLCRCGNEGKNAFPSYQTIADNCSISKSTAIRCMNKLVNIGLVVKKYRFKDGENYSNIYQVNYNLGSVTDTLGSVTEISPSFTLTPNKELPIKNYIEITNYLHHTTSDGVCLINLLRDFSLKTFNRDIRNHKGNFDLEEYSYIDSEVFIEFLEENITKYDWCNLSYLESIQARTNIM